MATSGSWTGSRTVSYGPQLKLSWSRTAVDIPNNRSKVKLTLQIYAGYNVYFSAPKSGRLHGSGFTYRGGFSGKGTKTIKTKEFWVNHNSDGSKSFSVSAWLDINVNMRTGYVSRISVGGTINLNTIPRESKLNSFSVYNSLAPSTSCRLDLSITRYSSSFTHLIDVKHGSTTIATWTGQGTPSTLYLSGSQVNTLLKRLSSSTSGTLTMVISTKNGSTTIGGYSSRTATATVNSGVKPSISGFSTSIDGSGRDKAIGKYVQSITRVSASFSRSAGYGANISSSSILIRKDSNHANRMTINSNSGTSGILSSDGLYEAIATVRDSRGRIATSRTTFTVEGYSKPKITDFSTERNSSKDTEVDIRRRGSWHELGGSNPASAFVERRQGSGDWVDLDLGFIDNLNGEFDLGVTSTGNNTTESYEFRLRVVDSFGKSVEATQTVSTAKVVLDIHKNDGVGIGKMHEQGVLDVDGNSYFNGAINAEQIDVKETVPTQIESGEDLNAITKSGTYRARNNAIAESIGNMPENQDKLAFALQVIQTTVNGCVQVMYPFYSGLHYFQPQTRTMHNGSWSDWYDNVTARIDVNSNGTAIRYADGTMICYNLNYTHQAGGFNYQEGGLYRASSVTWNYPIHFVGGGTFVTAETSDWNHWCTTYYNNEQGYCRIIEWAGKSGESPHTSKKLFAIGRWK